MSKYILLALMLSCQCFAQAPDVQWEHKYGAGWESEPHIIKAHGSGYLAALWTTAGVTNIEEFDYLLVRIDDAGNVLWQQEYGTGLDFGAMVVATPDGGYLLAGTTREVIDGTQSSSSSDIQVIKIDDDGAIQWSHVVGYPLDDTLNDIKLTPDGGFILAGVTDNGSGGTTTDTGLDALAIKLDADGAVQWQKTYGGSTSDIAKRVIPVAGGYMLGCTTRSGDGDVIGNHSIDNVDIWLLNLDNAGNIQSQKCYGSTGQETLDDLCASSDGGYVFIGRASRSDGDVTVPVGNWLVKIDNAGTIQWQSGMGSYESIWLYTIIQDSVGNYIIGGAIDPFPDAPPGQQTWGQASVWKLDNAGAVLWQKVMGGPRSDAAESILQTDDGYIFAGRYEQGLSHSELNADMWIVKLGSEPLAADAFLTASIAVTPNPASSVLNIAMPAGVEIERTLISDMSGKRVVLQTGSMRTVSVDHLASGIYLIEIFTSKGKKVLKFVKQ